MKGGGELAQKKMGRPKSDNPLKYEIKTAVDAATYAEAMSYCEKHGIDRATFARKAINELLKKEQ